MYGDYIAYDFWLGKVYDLTNHIILKLSNGARYCACVRAWSKTLLECVCECVCVTLWEFPIYLPNPVGVVLSVSVLLCRCSMSVEDGAKLYDVCPHVSDSVRCHRLLSVSSGHYRQRWHFTSHWRSFCHPFNVTRFSFSWHVVYLLKQLRISKSSFHKKCCEKRCTAPAVSCIVL